MRITTEVSSDFHYGKLIVELYVDGKFIFLLNQDAGLDNLVLEMPRQDANSEQILLDVPLEDFCKAMKIGIQLINSL